MNPKMKKEKLEFSMASIHSGSSNSRSYNNSSGRVGVSFAMIWHQTVCVK
jgi:hypothetical protein